MTNDENRRHWANADGLSANAANSPDVRRLLRNRARYETAAYTGGAMQLAGWRYPVVVDLEGLSVGRQRRPILLDHTRDVDFVMGQTDSVVPMNGQLIVAGQVMGESPKARQVIALNDKGFAWQASIGARADQVEFVAEGKTAQANGREFAGPVNIARRATLGEISFVVLGADDNTSAQIAATQPNKENEKMAFNEWLTAQGFDSDSLSESQTTSLQAMFDREQKPATPPENIPSPTQTLRAEAAAEAERIGAIHKLCAGKQADLEAKAIGEGWDVTRTELELLRAARPAGPAIHTSTKNHSSTAIEAAMCLSVKMPEEKVRTWYGDQTMEAAQSRDLRGIGLNELMHRVIQAAGLYVRPAGCRTTRSAPLSKRIEPCGLAVVVSRRSACQAFCRMSPTRQCSKRTQRLRASRRASAPKRM